MSRSAFSARFAELVGEPPMKYVTRWRMHLASILLRDRNRTIDDAAAQLGYGSAPAFSRAVKRFYGKWPGALRPVLASPPPSPQPGSRAGKCAETSGGEDRKGPARSSGSGL